LSYSKNDLVYGNKRFNIRTVSTKIKIKPVTVINLDLDKFLKNKIHHICLAVCWVDYNRDDTITNDNPFFLSPNIGLIITGDYQLMIFLFSNWPFLN